MKKFLLLISLLSFSSQTIAQEEIYIFMSFSMPNQAFKDYFTECERYGGIIKLKGVNQIENVTLYEKLLLTYHKIYELKINAEIDPELFERFGIQEVPAIVKVTEDKIYKISGHLSLEEALRIFAEEK